MFQECRLSPRILQGAFEWLFWDCSKSWEVGTEDGVVEFGQSKPEFRGFDLGHVIPRKFVFASDIRTTTTDWLSGAQFHSRQGIRSEPNKLPALSAVARQVVANTGAQYLESMAKEPHLQWNCSCFVAALSWQSDPTPAKQAATAKGFRCSVLVMGVRDRRHRFRYVIIPCHIAGRRGTSKNWPVDAEVVLAAMTPGHGPSGTGYCEHATDV